MKRVIQSFSPFDDKDHFKTAIFSDKKSNALNYVQFDLKTMEDCCINMHRLYMVFIQSNLIVVTIFHLLNTRA